MEAVQNPAAETCGINLLQNFRTNEWWEILLFVIDDLAADFAAKERVLLQVESIINSLHSSLALRWAVAPYKHSSRGPCPSVSI